MSVAGLPNDTTKLRISDETTKEIRQKHHRKRFRQDRGIEAHQRTGAPESGSHEKVVRLFRSKGQRHTVKSEKRKVKSFTYSEKFSAFSKSFKASLFLFLITAISRAAMSSFVW